MKTSFSQTRLHVLFPTAKQTLEKIEVNDEEMSEGVEDETRAANDDASILKSTFGGKDDDDVDENALPTDRHVKITVPSVTQSEIRLHRGWDDRLQATTSIRPST